MRIVCACGACEEIVVDAARTNAANAAADLMMANYNPLTRSMLKSFTVALVAFAAVASAPRLPGRSAEQSAERRLEWPVYGGDQGGTKYSPVADVDTSSV